MFSFFILIKKGEKTCCIDCFLVCWLAGSQSALLETFFTTGSWNCISFIALIYIPRALSPGWSLKIDPSMHIRIYMWTTQSMSCTNQNLNPKAVCFAMNAKANKKSECVRLKLTVWFYMWTKLWPCLIERFIRTYESFFLWGQIKGAEHSILQTLHVHTVQSPRQPVLKRHTCSVRGGSIHTYNN